MEEVLSNQQARPGDATQLMHVIFSSDDEMMSFYPVSYTHLDVYKRQVYARGYVGDPTGEYNGVKTGQDLKDNRSEDELLAEACLLYTSVG